MRKPLLLLCILLAFSSAGQSNLRFAVIGDTPYLKEEESKLRNDIEENNEVGRTDFIVHVGDILSSGCREEQYALVAEILSMAEVPVFVIPGDNEWNDCADPDKAWKYWEKHFLRFENRFELPFSVSRQEVRPENFSFVYRDVLVVGLNNVGGRMHDTTEWMTRIEQNKLWIVEQFNKHEAEVKAAVVFGHSMPRLFSFVEKFEETGKFFKKPVLYIQGDDHRWMLHEGWKAEHMSLLVIDQGSLTQGLQKVEVVPGCSKPFIYYRNNEIYGSDCMRLHLYPVPVANRLQVQLTAQAGPVRYEVLDLTGRSIKVYQSEQNGLVDYESLDLSELEFGVYVLRVIVGEEMVAQKFVKW